MSIVGKVLAAVVAGLSCVAVADVAAPASRPAATRPAIDAKQLIGTWTSETMTLTFEADGGYAQEFGGAGGTGTWVLEGEMIVVTLPGGTKMKMTIKSLEKDELEIRTMGLDVELTREEKVAK